MNKFKKGDFAQIENKIVEVLDILHIGHTYKYGVRMVHDTHTHWVYEKDLKTINNQTTPKILYKKSKKRK